MKKNIFIIVLIIIVLIVAGIYYFVKPQASSSDVPVAEVKAVLEKLERHIILPTDETPQIGRIDDPVQAAKAQPFVTGAEKGDLLIVYVKASKAIVYSPTRDIIINVGPVSMNPEPTAKPAPVETEISTQVGTKTPAKATN